MPTIFILDDDDDSLFTMEFWLKRKGYGVKSFIRSSQLLLGIKEAMPDVVLLDIYLNGEDGREICQYLKDKEKIEKPVFLISTFPEGCPDYTRYQADGLLEKPYHMKEFPALLQSKMRLQ